MFVGIDVAKAELVVSVLPSAERFTVANDERGVRTLVERLRAIAPALIVLEATGGYELLACRRARGGGTAGRRGESAPGARLREGDGAAREDRPHRRRHPRAASPTWYGRRCGRSPDAAAQELEALLARRRQLLEMLQAERNRTGQVVRQAASGREEELEEAHRAISSASSA